MIRATFPITAIIVLAATACFSGAPGGAAPGGVPQEDADAISRRDFMRTKLMYSQNMLEGLTTGHFETIDAAIAEMKLVTSGSKWVSIDSGDYRRLTADFEAALERLAESAATRSIDATAMRFYQMSTSCIDCHSHIRHAGYDLAP